MKALSKSGKLKAFIVSNMIYLIKFLDNSEKYAVYTEGNINGLYHYLDMIGYPKTLTTPGQRSHHLGPSSLIKKNT